MTLFPQPSSKPHVSGLWSLDFGLLFACAACYGQSDSPMAQGMNWGIFTLLGVIVAVLGGVAAFFVYLARRSAALATESASPTPGRANAPASPQPLSFPGRLGFSETLALPTEPQP